MDYIQTNESNINVILELFNKAVDENDFIVDKKTEKKIKCPYSKRYIKVNSFSILPGSATFVNNEAYCFAEHKVLH